MRERRNYIADQYTKGLKDLSGFYLHPIEANVRHAWHLYILTLDTEKMSICRDRVIDELRARDIGCAVHFIPLHFHSYYQRVWGYAPGQFPVAERHFARCISLPIYPGMSNGDVDRVMEALCDIHRKFRR
jgi:dTDP-4-amino-4,6-dideoxygalactose transaminase